MENLIELYKEINNFGRFMNMAFQVIEPGIVHYNMKVNENHLATPVAMHGGALAGFMDAIIGVSALSIVAPQNKLVSTVEFKINYLIPVLLNDDLKGIGKVIHHGNRIIIAKGEIYNQRKELVAIANGTLNAYPREKALS